MLLKSMKKRIVLTTIALLILSVVVLAVLFSDSPRLLTNKQLVKNIIPADGSYWREWFFSGFEDNTICGFFGRSGNMPMLSELLSRPSGMETYRSMVENPDQYFKEMDSLDRDSKFTVAIITEYFAPLLAPDLCDHTLEPSNDDFLLLQELCTEEAFLNWCPSSFSRDNSLMGLKQFTAGSSALHRLFHNSSAALSIYHYVPQMIDELESKNDPDSLQIKNALSRLFNIFYPNMLK